MEPDAPNDMLNGITEWANSDGFNAVLFEDSNRGDESDSYAVFSPDQIKSATGNRGTFSPDDANIFNQPQGSTRLMALHNLSLDNLQFADKIGGLAVPSIGIVPEEESYTDLGKLP